MEKQETNSGGKVLGLIQKLNIGLWHMKFVNFFFVWGGGITSDNHVPLFCNYHVIINIAYNPVLQFNMIKQNILKLIDTLSRRK